MSYYYLVLNLFLELRITLALFRLRFPTNANTNDGTIGYIGGRDCRGFVYKESAEKGSFPFPLSHFL